MSVDVYACWQGELKADKAAWQAALVELGFQANVLYEFSEAHGFWPIDLDGFKTGVEILLISDLEEFREQEVLAAALGPRDRLALFTFGSNAAEAGTALALAAALTKLTDAIIFDPQASEIYSTDRAVAEAKEMFEVARKEGAQERDDEE